MFTKLINEYKNINDDDYIYIVEGCLDNYVTKDMPMINVCDICGDMPTVICEGISKDIKRAKNFKQLDSFNENNIKIKKRIKSR